MWCRGIRGATVVAANTKEAILEAAEELLQEMVKANDVDKESIASVLFTTTPDLNAEFPAAAARRGGWTDVPLLGMQEMDVSDSLSKCLRILILFNTDKSPKDIVHVYLRGTEILRQ
jgi:chorismate mutase